MPTFRRFALSLGTVTALTVARPVTQRVPPEAVVAWARANAIRLSTVQAGSGFADMEPLRKVVGNARIVELGEATHGTREFFLLKHRMLEYLATQMGFTIFGIEANMPEAYRLNEYVLTGKGDPVTLLKGMYFWTWDTQEVLDMIRWMRAYNASGKGRLQFTGFDMQTPTVAAQIVDDFVAKTEPVYESTIRAASDMADQVNKGNTTGFGVATGRFPVREAAGKHVRYSGYIKTDGITRGYAGLWWRVDGDSGRLGFDNMEGRGPSGTTDWRQYTIDLPVAANARNINFGVILPGNGTAWFSDLTVELDGQRYTASEPNLDVSRWPAASSGGPGYGGQPDSTVTHDGHASLRIRYTPPSSGPQSFGVATGTFPVADAVGKRVRFSGYIKTDSITRGYAGLWWRVDGASGTLMLDNMSRRPVTGTTDWQRYDIDVEVSPGAKNINFGLLHPGDGTAWFSGLTVEVDGQPYQSPRLDLDFTSWPRGYNSGGAGYRIALDTGATHDGQRVLRMQYVGGPLPAAAEPVDPKLAVTRWQAIVAHLQASPPATQATDAAWALQNARVVLQAMQMRTDQVSRDQSMAENVKWILDQNPGAKMVVWAHNGHVSTAAPTPAGVGDPPMGAVLRSLYGSQMVAFGFAFGEGSFQAVELGKGLRNFTVAPTDSGTFDAMLAATGIPLFALDLRQAPKSGAVAEWLAASHKSRWVGSVYSEGNPAVYFTDMVAPRTFDAVLFVAKTTAATNNPK
jgi:erythromycin esterase-like protein